MFVTIVACVVGGIIIMAIISWLIELFDGNQLSSQTYYSNTVTASSPSPRPAPAPALTPAVPAQPDDDRKYTHVLINPEGERQIINTNDPGSQFRGMEWHRFFTSVEQHELMLAKIVTVVHPQNENRTAGYYVHFTEFDLRLGGTKNLRAFLPRSKAATLPENEQEGRHVVVSVHSFDRNTANIIVNEIPSAKRIANKDDAAKLREKIGKLINSAKERREVRGKIVRVVHKETTVGLIIDVCGLEAFMPAVCAIGLTVLSQDLLIGLPVTGLLEVRHEKERFKLSLSKLYKKRIKSKTKLEPGAVVEGVSYAITPDGTEWQSLLPNNSLGHVVLSKYNLSAQKAREQCGWIGSVKILGQLRAAGSGMRTILEIIPIYDTRPEDLG